MKVLRKALRTRLGYLQALTMGITTKRSARDLPRRYALNHQGTVLQHAT